MSIYPSNGQFGGYMNNPNWGGSGTWNADPFSGGMSGGAVNTMNPERGGWGGVTPGMSYGNRQALQDRYSFNNSLQWGDPFGQTQYQWTMNPNSGRMELMSGIPWQQQRQNQVYGMMMGQMGQGGPYGQGSGQGQGNWGGNGGPSYTGAPQWQQPGAFQGGSYQAGPGYSGSQYQLGPAWGADGMSGVMQQGYNGMAPGSSLDPQSVINASLPGLDEARQQGFAGAGARAGQSGFAMSTPYMEALGGVERKTQNDLSQLTQGYLYDAAKFKAQQDLAAQQSALDRSLSAWGTQAGFGHEGQLSDLGREFDAWRQSGQWGHEGQLSDLAREFGAWQQSGDWQTRGNDFNRNVWQDINDRTQSDYWNNANMNMDWQNQWQGQNNLNMDYLMQLYGMMGGGY